MQNNANPTIWCRRGKMEMGGSLWILLQSYDSLLGERVK